MATLVQSAHRPGQPAIAQSRSEDPVQVATAIKFDDWRAISKDAAINAPIFANILRGSKLTAAWYYVGQHAFIDYQRNQQMQRNAQWPVTLSYHQDTQALMTALQNNLEAVQFKITSQPGGDETQLKGSNVIRYHADA